MLTSNNSFATTVIQTASIACRKREHMGFKKPAPKKEFKAEKQYFDIAFFMPSTYTEGEYFTGSMKAKLVPRGDKGGLVLKVHKEHRDLTLGEIMDSVEADFQEWKAKQGGGNQPSTMAEADAQEKKAAPKSPYGAGFKSKQASF